MLMNELVAEDVVDMAMGIDQAYRPQLFAADLVDQQLLFFPGVTTGVKDHAFSAFVIYYIGILLKRVEGQFNDLCHLFLARYRQFRQL